MICSLDFHCRFISHFFGQTAVASLTSWSVVLVFLMLINNLVEFEWTFVNCHFFIERDYSNIKQVSILLASFRRPYKELQLSPVFPIELCIGTTDHIQNIHPSQLTNKEFSWLLLKLPQLNFFSLLIINLNEDRIDSQWNSITFLELELLRSSV